jgi:hypothetical protein
MEKSLFPLLHRRFIRRGAVQAGRDKKNQG